MSTSVHHISPSRSGSFFVRMFAVISIASIMLTGAGTAAMASNPRYAGIVVDARTGNVLYSENADRLQYPASLTKMMTLYLTFEALEKGRITLDTPVPVSAFAASQPPTKLGVRPGGSITVHDAMLGLITLSANDAATALGELLGGSEERFAQMMTAKAHALGMTRTTYRNANGLPNTAQMTTARDQARLGIALRQHFPQYYGYFSQTSYKFGSRTINGHNRLVGNVPGVDGIKTGYTRAAGYNLATSVQIDGHSIVGVVLGAASTPARDLQMRKLIAAYLTKSSRGNKDDLIAQTGPRRPAPIAASEPVPAPQAAAKVAMPMPAPQSDARFQTASASTAFAGDEPSSPSSANPLVDGQMPGPSKVKIQAIKQTASIATPRSAEKDEAIDALTTASTKTADEPKGWVVQIGVADSRDAAIAMLDAARAKAGKSLASAKSFAVAYAGGYRARFGGFSDQAEATGACKSLKHAGVKCWAAAQ